MDTQIHMYQNKHEYTTKIQKHDQIYRNVHQCQETRLYSIAIQLWWKVNSSLQIWPDLASISTPFYFHILFSYIHMKNIWRFMNPSQFLLHWNLLSISICDHHGGKNWSFINVQYQYSPIGQPVLHIFWLSISLEVSEKNVMLIGCHPSYILTQS